MVIDSHMHVFTEANDLKSAERMATAGVVNKAFLLSSHVTTFNEGDAVVLDVAKHFPDFYVPFAHFDFTKPASHIDDLKARGFFGLKAIFPPKPYDDEDFWPLYERAERNRMPIVFHTAGTTYWPPEMYKNVAPRAWGARYMHVFHLDILAKLFPKLICIAAHLGAPWYDEAINVVSGHPNVYADLSDGFLIAHIEVALKAVHHVKLEDKLLFGVDTHMNDVEWELKVRHFWELFLSQNVRQDVYEKIMGKNAQRLLTEAGTPTG